MGGGKKKIGNKVQGIRSTDWQVQHRQGDVKNSRGNREAKELICMTHRHELRRILLEGMGLSGRGGQRGKTGTIIIA